MRVHWTRLALAHLLAGYEQMAHAASWYVQSLMARRTKRLARLATSPQSRCLVSEDAVPDNRMADKMSNLVSLVRVHMLSKNH